MAEQLTLTGRPARPPGVGTMLYRLHTVVTLASRGGVSLDEIELQGLEEPRQQLNTMLNRLVDKGLAFKAGKGRKSSERLRFFLHEADALAWDAGHRANPPSLKPPCAKQAKGPDAAPVAAPRTAKRVRTEPKSRHQKAEAEMLERRYHFNERLAAFKGSNVVKPEPVITDKTRRTVAPTPPDYRHAVSGPVIGGLRTMGIGRYTEEASGWAVAAGGGAV